MTRTDVMASSRPLTTGEREPRTSVARMRHALALMGVLALLAAALPGTALAAEGTSGYGSTPTTPATPSTGTSPSTETSTPAAKEEEPSKSSTTPSTGKEAKSSTLPFTGFDLRWSFAIGLALMGAGFSIIAVQRRARRGGSR